MHYARFHAADSGDAPHWAAVSQRLVVELHASRLRLETASDICGPPPPVAAPMPTEGVDEHGQGGMDEEEEEEDEEAEAALPTTKRLVARPLVVGHRGASGHRVGNSLEAFHHAVALGTCAFMCLWGSGWIRSRGGGIGGVTRAQSLVLNQPRPQTPQGRT